MKRRSSSNYQVSATPSLSTAPSLPSQHYSMGSLPLFISPCHLYEQKEHFTLPGIMNTLTEHSYLTPLSTLPFPCSTLHDTSMKRRSSSNYQVSATPSLSTAPSLPSQHYSMGSLPLFISPCHLYEQKEHFTLPGIMNTLTEHSYLTPLSTLPFPCSTLPDTSMKRRSPSHYQVSATTSLSTATLNVAGQLPITRLSTWVPIFSK